jgi:hypothetical protein
VLLERFWWGSVFLLALPVMALLLLLGPRVLPEYRAPDAGRLDLPSAALSLVAVLAVVFGLKQVAQDGLGGLAVSAVKLTPLWWTPLAERGLDGHIAHKGTPAPIQASTRWSVERTHAWGNAFASSAGAPSGADGWSSSTWRWRTRSSSWVGWSAARGPATAGRLAQADARNRPGVSAAAATRHRCAARYSSGRGCRCLARPPGRAFPPPAGMAGYAGR